MLLAMANDALKRQFNVPILLRCPYFPYARQDRVCNEGEALSVRVMADMINAMNFARVEIWDAHSDVTTAVLNNCVNVTALPFVRKITRAGMFLVSPDAGALKKTMKIGSELNLPVLRADKTRDSATGLISGTVLHDDPNAHRSNRDFLIVDDICDGGRTFISLANVCHQHTTGKIMLYVTHGIFSYGLDVFDGIIDEIYTANPWPKYENDPRLHVIKGTLA